MTVIIPRERKTYSAILADPPWLHSKYGQEGHGAARGHYDGVPDHDMVKVPVGEWGRKDSFLFLWAVNPKVDEAVDLMRAWGYKLVFSVPWIKTLPTEAELRRGIGFWSYSCSEQLFVCRKGKARGKKAKRFDDGDKPFGLLTGDRRAPIYYAPRGPHSRKPQGLYDWIESSVPGPNLELYARQQTPGWTSFGLEVGWYLDEKGATPLESLPCPVGDTHNVVLSRGGLDCSKCKVEFRRPLPPEDIEESGHGESGTGAVQGLDVDPSVEGVQGPDRDGEEARDLPW